MFRSFRSFSEDEMKEFKKFVESPYFNRKGNLVIILFDELKKYYPDFESERLTLENIFKKLYSGKTYNDQLMRRVSSDLIKLVEEFLIQINLAREAFDKNLHLLKEYSLKNLHSFFEREQQKLEKDHYSRDKSDNGHYEEMYKLEFVLYDHYLLNPKQHLASHHPFDLPAGKQAFHFSLREKVFIVFKRSDNDIYENRNN